MKITGGQYRGRQVEAPNSEITRPTLSKTREAVFNVLFSMIDFEGKSFLDTFAGSGIMGLEAISRGFENVVCIEKNFKTASVLKSNYLKLKLKPNFYLGDSLKILPKLNFEFDVIYIDPPYQSDLYSEILNLIKDTKLLKKDGIIVLEHSKDVNWEGFKLVKQKVYSQKFISFLVE